MPAVGLQSSPRNGVPGRIQVTHAVYVGLRERYVLEERGTVSIKGKGNMTTYFLVSRRAEASRQRDG
jgi:adenylate cyclase